MKTFIDEIFLLETDIANELYNRFAKDMPIFDYHCHLPPEQIAENKKFKNLTEIWLYGDHYKWRAMRSNGISEKYCTGSASDWEKFKAWAKTVPYTIRNPLYHWIHLELRVFFGIKDRLLNENTARYIYDKCNELLQSDDFTTRAILKKMKVAVVCTTDDPIDTLEQHQKYGKLKNTVTKMYPTWRPDRAMQLDNTRDFNKWVNKLAEAADTNISGFKSFMEAIKKRHDFFHSLGCRVSDHGIETVYAEDYKDREIKLIFDKARANKQITGDEILKFKSAMLYQFGILDHSRGWVQQLHVGALRNNNTRLLKKLGPDTGFDSIGDFGVARTLAKFLDRLDNTNQLARTILYNLNPRDNELMATMIGNFQDSSVPGKMQYGSGWWFLDQKDGMEAQMKALSNLGLLSRFIGMTTDSRSFLSYSRHEYFRRILCNLLGNDVRKKLIPDDMDLLGRMVQDICYNNAKKYFGLKL